MALLEAPDGLAPGGMGEPPPELAGQPPMGPMEPPQAAEPELFYDVTVIRKRKYGCARVEAVPPEEFGISRRAKLADGMNSVDYCFHETTKSAHELISQGFDKTQIKALPVSKGQEDGTESQSRDTVDETDDSGGVSTNWVTRSVVVTEHYARLDYEGKGKPKLYRVTTGGGQSDILKRKGKLAIDEIEEVPFASMTPVIVSHRFFGRSMADLVMDIQRIKTAILRALLDGIYLANNQRLEVAESHAVAETIDDILNNRPGGIVRSKQPGGIIPIPNSPIGDFAYQMLEYQDATREWRTGVTRQGQGIDAKALADQSATAAMQMFTMAQARMRLIARIFAETGVRDLFLLLHAVIRRNDRKKNTVRLRNKWVAVDPQEWKRRNDMTVHVGVGTGGKAEQLMFLLQLLNIQKEAVLSGSGLATVKNLFNTLTKIVEMAGLKSVAPYFEDPEGKPPPQPPPDPKMMAVQAKAKADQAKQQADMMLAQQDAALDKEKMEREFQLKVEQLQAEMALKREQLAAELALKRQQIAFSAQVSMATSQVRMGGKPG